MSARFRRRLALLLFLAAVILLAGVGLRSPWPADEPRFALIAKEMVEGGSWLFPHVAGDLYPDKPPLFFWFVALVYAMTGSTRVAILIPGAIAGLGVLLLTTDLARRLRDERTAIWSGLTLLVMMQFALQMKSGQIDGLLCLWTTLSLYGFCRHLLLGPDWRWYAAGGAAAGLGIITKGVGILPYLVLIPYAFAARGGWGVNGPGWRDARWFVAPVATLLVIGAWLVPMLIAVERSGDVALAAYRDNILFHQTVTRYADSFGHIKPPWYLLTNAIPWLWLPVTALLPWLIPAWRRDLRNRDAGVLLLGGWVLLVILFFSLTAGKRSLYIFPAAPALALIAGFHAEALLARAGARRALLATVILIGALLAGLGAYLLARPEIIAERLGDGAAEIVAAGALLGIGGLVLAAAAVGRVRRAPAAYLAMVVTIWLGYGFAVVPAINDARSGAALMAELRGRVDAGQRIGFVDWPEQFLLQWEGHATHFGHRRDKSDEMRDAATWLAGDRSRRVLLPSHLVGQCLDLGGAQYVGHAHRRDWYLAGRDALTGRCPVGARQPVVLIRYPQGGRSGAE